MPKKRRGARKNISSLVLLILLLSLVMPINPALAKDMPSGDVLPVEERPAEETPLKEAALEVVPPEAAEAGADARDESAAPAPVPDGGDAPTAPQKGDIPGPTLREGGDPSPARESSADLQGFLHDASVLGASLGPNGEYVVVANQEYWISLHFGETEELQFADRQELRYVLPAGLQAGSAGPIPFSIGITDENGSATVEGNTFRVDGDAVYVNFNQSDPNFVRLTGLANVAFQILISARLDGSATVIGFAEGLALEFEFQEATDLNVTKKASYDKASNRALYELKVTSTGANSDVLLRDQITGTILLFNKDVQLSSNKPDPPAFTTDYDAPPNGFELRVDHMESDEVLTITYSAEVLADQLNIGSGSAAQTGNAVSVQSAQITQPRTAEADLRNLINFYKVSKKAMTPRQTGANTYEVDWVMEVNNDRLLTTGGTRIRDRIGGSSQPFLSFVGSGVTVEVTKESGEIEIRTLPWSDLQPPLVGDESRYFTADGRRVGWTYVPPLSDGKAKYKFTMKTEADTTRAVTENLTLFNSCYIGRFSNGASVRISLGGSAEDQLGMTKSVVNATAREVEWELSLNVARAGYPDLVVRDDLPRNTGLSLYDTFVEGSLEIGGLLDGESYQVRKITAVPTAGGATTLSIQFYRDPGMTQKGLLPNPAGTGRTLSIRLKSKINQDWLEASAQTDYKSYYQHLNSARALVGSAYVDASAYVVPRKQSLKKEFLEKKTVTIDGVDYPVYTYALILERPFRDTAIIEDAFDRSYLKYYAAEAVSLAGGDSPEGIADTANGQLAVTETGAGMTIEVGRFPKKGANFYPYYRVTYALIAKDSAALAAMNEAAFQKQDGFVIRNTARWDENVSDAVETRHTYFPYLDKLESMKPEAGNHYIAEYKIVINRNGDDLDPDSDTLTVADALSPNLRFLVESLSFEPLNLGATFRFDSDSNTIYFENLPDGRRIEITYWVKVLADEGPVAYFNTARLGEFERQVESAALVEAQSGNSGTGSKPSITLVKRDKDDLTQTLAGAQFKLFYLDARGEQIPVQDKDGADVIFTSGPDGKVRIAGNREEQGWTLWTDRIYRLVEIKAPTAYRLDPTPVEFKIVDFPKAPGEYALTGEQISAQNERAKRDIPVEKRWIGPATGSVTIKLFADGLDTGKTLVLDAANNWQGRFAGLPIYRDDGEEIVYSIDEASVPEQYEKTVEGFVVKNTNIETLSIRVSKTWSGPQAASATVRLLADGVEAGRVTLTEANRWQHAFEGLPKYARTDGHLIVYTIAEEEIANYESQISGSSAHGYTVINTYKPPKIEVTGRKVWEGGASPRPTIKLQLYRNGAPLGAPVKLADGTSAYTWTNLDKTDGTGLDYVYTVDEVDVPENYAKSNPDALTVKNSYVHKVDEVALPENDTKPNTDDVTAKDGHVRTVDEVELPSGDKQSDSDGPTAKNTPLPPNVPRTGEVTGGAGPAGPGRAADAAEEAPPQGGQGLKGRVRYKAASKDAATA